MKTPQTTTKYRSTHLVAYVTSLGIAGTRLSIDAYPVTPYGSHYGKTYPNTTAALDALAAMHSGMTRIS